MSTLQQVQQQNNQLTQVNNQLTQKNNQLTQQNNQLTQRVNELTRFLEDTNRKIQIKENVIKNSEAENRKNLAEINRLHSVSREGNDRENHRLIQQSTRTICQKCSMRSN